MRCVRFLVFLIRSSVVEKKPFLVSLERVEYACLAEDEHQLPNH